MVVGLLTATSWLDSVLAVIARYPERCLHAEGHTNQDQHDGDFDERSDYGGKRLARIDAEKGDTDRDR
jgi:hypothetical protein